MGQVTLTIAGRSHHIACRDGEEAHLERLGKVLAAHADTAQRAAGGHYERTLVFLGLILADELDEAARAPREAVSSALLEKLADRVEAVATALEDRGANA